MRIHALRTSAAMGAFLTLGCVLAASRAQGQSFVEGFGGNGVPLELEESGGSPNYGGGVVAFPGSSDYDRRYLRTFANYNTQNFIAEVTVTVASCCGGSGMGFFGLGVGQGSSFFNEPRTSPSTYVRIGPDDFFSFFAITDSFTENIGTTPNSAGSGTHRVRLTWDHVSQTFTAAIQKNYTGGAFSPTTTIVLTPDPETYGNDNTRIFIGGAGNATFDDLRVIALDGTPGAIDCHGQSVSGLVHQFGSAVRAASELGFANVAALQSLITGFCGN